MSQWNLNVLNRASGQIHPELPPKYEAAIAGMEIIIIAIILV